MKTKSAQSTPRRTATQRRLKSVETWADYRVKRGKNGVLWISTDKSMDRDGEVVLPSGVVLDAFDKNPILLFGHDHQKPIGRVVDYTVGEERNTFVPEFAKSSQEAQTIKGLVDDGVLRATSIGFLPLELGEKVYEQQLGNTYARWELLEQSIVAVPSNRGALMAAAKRMKSVATIAPWFGMPEVERVATKRGVVRGFRFDSVDEVLAFAKRHEEREKELEQTKQAEGQFKGTTQKSGEGDGHEHSFLVAIESGAVTIGKTSDANGHFHDIREIGVTEPAGEDGHVHEWAVSPGSDDAASAGETVAQEQRSASGVSNRAQKASGDDDDFEEFEDSDEDGDDAQEHSAAEDEGETDFDLDSDADLDEVLEEVASEFLGLQGETN